MKAGSVLCAAALMSGGVLLLGQSEQTAMPQPRRQFGSSVTGAFEGWYISETDKDFRGFLVGYFNRNTQQELDVPIGPNNRIEPGGPDLGQPTHFLPGRKYGMFVIPVPKDFKPTDKYTWTIVANGQPATIPLRLQPDYVISPFSEIAVGNTPPVIRFEPNGTSVEGPIAMLAHATVRTTSLSTPLQLTLWITDDMKYTNGTSSPLTGDRPPVTLLWSKYRGTGTVKFDKANPKAEGAVTEGQGFSGKATTNVTFSEPGDYVLQVTVNDYSGDGGGGFQCCWTTALVKVSVAP